MPKRFNDLQRAAKLAGGNGAPDSPLDKFNKWRTGQRDINYVRDPSSNPGSSVLIAIAPFGIGTTDKYSIRISGRVSSALSGIGGSQTYNHTAASDSDKVNPGFEPANAIVLTSGTSTTNEISKITGLPYKKRSNAKSYTVPFGGGTAQADKVLLTVTTEIRVALKTIAPTSKVSFTPERWRL